MEFFFVAELPNFPFPHLRPSHSSRLSRSDAGEKNATSSDDTSKIRDPWNVIKMRLIIIPRKVDARRQKRWEIRII